MLTPIINKVCRLGVWLRRFRHRRGYGIHSPFAFNFVTDVAYNRGTYYAYADLRRYYEAHCGELGALRWRDCRLLFRLANYQGARRVCLVGYADGGQRVSEFVRAGSQEARFFTVEDASALAKVRPDFVLVNANWNEGKGLEPEKLVEHLPEGAMLVLTGVGGRRQKAWQRLLGYREAQIAFDLYDFGIVMNRPDLNRAHYVVNW